MKMNIRRKFLLVALGLVLMVAFWMPSPGKAQGINFGSSIPEGQVVDRNLVLNGTDVSIDGTVNGDVLAFGQTITVNGQVNGTLVAVGQSITINGQVSNSVLAAGVMVEVGEGGQVGRDLYFVGARLTLAEGSAAKRDVNCISLEAQFAGDIGRDLHAVVGPLQIAETFFVPLRDRITLISATGQEALPQANTPILAGIGSGLLAPASSWLAEGQKTAQQAAQVDTERLKTWGMGLLRNLIALLVIGLLGIWLLPAPFNWATEKVKQTPWRMALSGLTFYVGGWFIAVLAFGLIVVLALFFYVISLPNLGFLLGTLGLMGLGLGVSVFWLSITYVSKLIIAFLIGKLLLQRFAPRYAQSNLWPLLLGVVLYALVASIPFLGWVVATLVTFFGLGALWVVAFQPTFKQPVMESPPALAQTD
jgi:cytoskeletal protein CcmA (bactofilin family)